MNRTGVAAAALASAVSGMARGQGTVTYSWRFLEVVAGTPGIGTLVANPDSMIEPGEAARVVLGVSFTPGVGSPVTYTPPPAPGNGTIAGLGSMGFNFIADPGVGGSWSALRRNPAWAMGSAGDGENGSVFAAQAGQFVLPGQTANATNPIPAIWMGVWTPMSYAARTARFVGHDPGFTGFANLLIVQYGTDPNTGDPLYVGLNSFGSWGSLQIPVVPAPGAAAVLGLVGFAGMRRRRGGRLCS